MDTKRRIDAALLKQIDELCDAMDREWVMAQLPSRDGKKWLDEYRDYYLRLVRDGLPLPDCWHAGEKTEQIDERFAAYGTREWRKAYPWLVEKMRKDGRNV